MTGEHAHGEEGERIVERLLSYSGWTLIERHPMVHGHTLDLLAKHPDHEETLFEVKVWTSARSGKDNVKKAIADADDLRRAGETRPYVLVLSHELAGLHQMMLSRAMAAGVITEVLILTLMPMTRSVLP